MIAARRLLPCRVCTYPVLTNASARRPICGECARMSHLERLEVQAENEGLSVPDARDARGRWIDAGGSR
jgi:hypothetical protein